MYKIPLEAATVHGIDCKNARKCTEQVISTVEMTLGFRPEYD